MKTLKEKIEVMQAALDGEEIECIVLGKPQDKWEEIRYTTSLVWDWLHEDYRIKPKPLEFWVNVCHRSNFVSHYSRQDAINATCPDCIKIIKVREVLDENL